MLINYNTGDHKLTQQHFRQKQRRGSESLSKHRLLSLFKLDSLFMAKRQLIIWAEISLTAENELNIIDTCPLHNQTT